MAGILNPVLFRDASILLDSRVVKRHGFESLRRFYIRCCYKDNIKKQSLPGQGGLDSVVRARPERDGSDPATSPKAQWDIFAWSKIINQKEGYYAGRNKRSSFPGHP